jgi:hypothetical protein
MPTVSDDNLPITSQVEISGDTDRLTNIASQTISGYVDFTSATLGGGLLTLTDNNVAIGFPAREYTGAWSRAITLTEGRNIIAAKAQLAFRNSVPGYVSISITLDTIAPTVAITSGGSTLTNVANQTIAGTGETGTTIRLTDNGAALGAPITVVNGGWSQTVTLPNQGANNIVATDTDAAGNVGTSSAISFTVDTVAPIIAITSASRTVNDVANQTVFGTGETGTTVQLMDNMVAIGAPVTVVAGGWSQTITLPTRDINNIVATDTDAAGNVGSSAPISITFQPKVAITGITTNSIPGVLIAGETIDFTLTVASAVTVIGQN